MWRTIGSVTSPDNKSNKSRDQMVNEPFSHSSRIKLNESQLSIDSQDRFASKFLQKKRSPEGGIAANYLNNRTDLNSSSISSSMKQLLHRRDEPSKPIHTSRIIKVQKKESFSSAASIDRELEVDSSLTPIKKSLKASSNQINTSIDQIALEQQKILIQEINSLQKQHNVLKKFVKLQLTGLKDSFKNYKSQIVKTIDKITNIEEIKKNGNHQTSKSMNPEILQKIKIEKIKFNEKIANIENKQKALKEKLNKK